METNQKNINYEANYLCLIIEKIFIFNFNFEN